MASPPLPPPPKKDFLQWVLAHPEEVEAYLQRIIALSRLEIVVRSANGVTRIPVEFSRENSVATLPPIEIESNGNGNGGAASGFGDVFGPSSATAENLASFFDAGGKRLKDAGASLADIDPRGLHSLWIPAVVMQPSASGGCAPLATVGLEEIIDGGDAGDEFTEIIDGGTAADEFADIIDGNQI